VTVTRTVRVFTFVTVTAGFGLAVTVAVAVGAAVAVTVTVGAGAAFVLAAFSVLVSPPADPIPTPMNQAATIVGMMIRLRAHLRRVAVGPAGAWYGLVGWLPQVTMSPSWWCVDG
jgi:hypothetical protein